MNNIKNTPQIILYEQKIVSFQTCKGADNVKKNIEFHPHKLDSHIFKCYKVLNTKKY